MAFHQTQKFRQSPPGFCLAAELTAYVPVCQTLCSLPCNYSNPSSKHRRELERDHENVDTSDNLTNNIAKFPPNGDCMPKKDEPQSRDQTKHTGKLQGGSQVLN